MKNRNKINILRIYRISLICIAVILSLFLCVRLLTKTSSLYINNSFLITFGVFVLLSIPADKLVLKMPHIGNIRFSEIIYYASFIVLPPIFLVILISVSILHNYFLKAKKIVKKNILFIAANSILIFIPASLVYDYMSIQTNNSPLFLQKNFPAFMFASIICYFLKNTLDNLNKIAAGKSPAYYFWNFHSNKTLINLFILAPLSFFAGVTAKLNIAIFLTFMLPILLIFKTLQNYTSLLFEIREALKTISFLIDKKDKNFIFHSYSVANLSKKIAHKLKLNEKYVEKIYHASLIHDLGKIAVSDQLLRKETALTAQEYEKIKKHPLIGADLINRLSILSDEAVIIKHHHENYDGTGYPEGLSREKIPLGARILAVSEAYNTMISSGVSYAKKMPYADALEEIKLSKGFKFDPKIVEVLINVLKMKKNEY